ncbi:MAG: hypothetical protein WAK17_14650, partial [Candidatus Nitrosopolaris sp.]
HRHSREKRKSHKNNHTMTGLLIDGIHGITIKIKRSLHNNLLLFIMLCNNVPCNRYTPGMIFISCKFC